MPPSRPQAALLAASAALLLAAGCGPPPQPPAPPTPVPPPASAASPPPTFPIVPATPGQGVPSGGFGEQFAIDCGGEPSDDDVLGLLREEDLLDADADIESVEGPRCAGTWQYTVVNVANLDPLHVVTEGEPGDLELVTAGTDVCTPEVRIQAPPGIRDAAACAG